MCAKDSRGLGIPPQNAKHARGDRWHTRTLKLSLILARRVPVAAVEMQTGGTWVALQSSTNNMWTLNSPGYQLPMPIRITPSCGAPVRLLSQMLANLWRNEQHMRS